MSTYIQVPNSILVKLTSKRKNKIEAFIYTSISAQIKDDTRKASYDQKALAELIGESERSVNTYISELKEKGFFSKVEKKNGGYIYPYNVYYIPYLHKDYFVVKKEFIYRMDISPELKGLMLFIKANCWAGTNHLSHNGITTDLAEKLVIGKNSLSGKLKELEAKGYIRFIDNTLIITDDSFPLFMVDTLNNRLYQTIYDFCLYKNRVPPYKKDDGETFHYDKALTAISATYQDEKLLKKALEERCKTLPEDLSLDYFRDVLTNYRSEKRDKSKPHTIIID